MGPRFCKRGNANSTPPPAAAAAMLQWGHAFVSVETSARPFSAAPPTVASMGPRFCKRGNEAASWVQSLKKLLQWGHAFVSVETCPPTPPPPAWLSLQWGHAFVSVETAQAFLRYIASLTASMGPRFCKRGNRVRTSTGTSRARGFNGATLL